MRDYSLSEAQVEAFFRDGFIGPLPAFASDEELTAAAERCVRNERERPVHPLFGRFSVRELHLIDPVIRRLVTHPAVATPLTQLLGEDLLLWRTTSFVKPPHTGPLMWHQDDGFYRGLEYGNDIAALEPDIPPGVSDQTQVPPEDWWDITLWIALTDVTEAMGPLRMIRGSQNKMMPSAQVPLPEAVFFDPAFKNIRDVEHFVQAAQDGTLVIDVDTSSFFDEVDLDSLSFEQARQIVLARLSEMTGDVLLPFEVDESRVVSLPMRRGEVAIFTERVVHGSGPNTTDTPRAGLVCRVTTGSTRVYPGRLRGIHKDGSNLDIRRHYSLKLSGSGFHPDNAYAPEDAR
ncbi:MAG: phytanoyl-CoA dioxygenase family protein [Alphaproteobacteria bacterium]|nr:phytanoyl-CoA dioxygenase family protein [Alphaproteobacteria bacterium]